MGDATAFGFAAAFYAAAFFTGFAGASHCFAAGFDLERAKQTLRIGGIWYLALCALSLGLAVFMTFTGLGD